VRKRLGLAYASKTGAANHSIAARPNKVYLAVYRRRTTERTIIIKKMHRNLSRLRCLKLPATLLFAGVCFIGCQNSNKPPESTGPTSSPSAPASTDASDIVKHYFALDRGRDSSLTMRVKIDNSGPEMELDAPSEVQVVLRSKQTPDGGRVMLVEFLSPAQERDRDSLITIKPSGEAEGLRYVQSNNSFLTTRGVTNEDSLFGMTIQELADGQPEKYDFWLSGEGRVGEWQVYKLEGKLKAGAESKFPRLVLMLAKDSYAAVGAEFYDNHNELARRMTVQTLEQVAGHWTRMKWTLENPARGKRLEFQTADARYDQNLDDSLFTREHLKKIASR